MGNVLLFYVCINDGTPYELKGSRTVRSGGKDVLSR